MTNPNQLDKEAENTLGIFVIQHLTFQCVRVSVHVCACVCVREWVRECTRERNREKELMEKQFASETKCQVAQTELSRTPNSKNTFFEFSNNLA